MTVLLGPCRCQGCGEEVVLLTDGRILGWLHPNGGFACGERFCGKCNEWWPNGAPYWYDNGAGYPICKACHATNGRLAEERRSRERLAVAQGREYRASS